MLNQNQWVSEAELQAARGSGMKCCPTCRGYGAPGFLINANQWVSCFKCNPTTTRHESKLPFASLLK